MSVRGPLLSDLLRAVRVELLARPDLEQAPLQPSGQTLPLRVVIDEDGTTDLTADGAEWRRDGYNQVALQLGDATWEPTSVEGRPGEGTQQIWRRQLELTVVVWARDDTACGKRLQAVVSALHRRIAGSYAPARDTKIPRRATAPGVMRKLLVRLDLSVDLDDAPDAERVRVVLESAGVDNTPGTPGDGVADAFEEP